MCSAAVMPTWNLPSLARSDRSLIRTAFSDASVAVCAVVWCGRPIAKAQHAAKIRNLDHCIRITFFDNFIARYNLSGSAQRRRDAAIFLIGEFDGLRDCLFGQPLTAHDMLNKQASVCARMLVAPFATHFDAVIGHQLPLLFHVRDDTAT